MNNDIVVKSTVVLNANNFTLARQIWLINASFYLRARSDLYKC